MKLFFDIETGPRKEAIEAHLLRKPYKPFEPLGPFDPQDVKLGAMTDTVKIKNKFEREEEKHGAKQKAHASQYNEDQAGYAAGVYDKAALDPALAEILCIQYAVGNGPTIIIGSAGGNEAEIIRTFFEVAEPCQGWVNWTGNNRSGGNFDLNFIYRRGRALLPRLPISAWNAAGRVKSDELASRFLFFADWGSYLSLENAARELSIPLIDSPVTGQHFHKWWKGEMEGDSQRKEAILYAKQDIILMQAIAARLDGNSEDHDTALGRLAELESDRDQKSLNLGE